jgi:hypothetical protein
MRYFTSASVSPTRSKLPTSFIHNHIDLAYFLSKHRVTVRKADETEAVALIQGVKEVKTFFIIRIALSEYHLRRVDSSHRLLLSFSQSDLVYRLFSLQQMLQ